ncbi:MAG TPA: [protein-PII] uridylyltransferase [Terriglobia bacterium]|nr:[protein-PII] uridylyltransferase [Terriglobia bacterium]
MPNSFMQPASSIPGYSATELSYLSYADLPRFYAAERARIWAEFESSKDGGQYVLARTALVDVLVQQTFREFLSRDLLAPRNFCLVAVGGYGRQELFPHSDVDLLFLSSDNRSPSLKRDTVSAMLQALWDLRLRIGHSNRTLADCYQFQPDQFEFTISLLDARYLAGGWEVFENLRQRAIPHLVARERQAIVARLEDFTVRRHQKHGGTIFHLEPNVKDAPGGLRDVQVARWLSQIANLEEKGAWDDPELGWPAAMREAARDGFRFLCDVRCFLHGFRSRDDNLLTYELQELAAAKAMGMRGELCADAADWMRHYFRKARSVDALATRMMEGSQSARTSLYGLYQDWKSRVSNTDFSVVRGRIFPRRSPLTGGDPALLFQLFEMVARHDLELSPEAGRWVEENLRSLDENQRAKPSDSKDKFPLGCWSHLRPVLSLPHSDRALRAMHQQGVIAKLILHFRLIDALVIRDYYHRYTVDEHTLRTIQCLADLRAVARSSQQEPLPGSMGSWRKKFAELLFEIERPDLVTLALLVHDIGKGMEAEEHLPGSIVAAEQTARRLGLNEEERETVEFLVAHHLEMSSAIRRLDTFDPQTVRWFSEKMGTVERLKMLCLVTYADIQAVNPEAMTPWKAEALWQFHVHCTNYLARSVDEERLEVAGPASAEVQKIAAHLGPSANPQDISHFLNGFPRRYLQTHTSEEIAAHFSRAVSPKKEKPLHVSVRRRESWYELTLIAADQPGIFSTLAGFLMAWGMNILKVEAFANCDGIIVDTFRFSDLFRTLELNPAEKAKLENQLLEVLTGNLELDTLLSSRLGSHAALHPKVRIPTRITFDPASSSHSTLLELVTQDFPGLLYHVSSLIADQGHDIHIALIDTEGQKAIDAFYLTSQGKKLSSEAGQALREAILNRLEQVKSTPTGLDPSP